MEPAPVEPAPVEPVPAEAAPVGESTPAQPVEPEADPAAGELAAVTEAAPAVEPAPTAEPAPEATAAPEVAPAETAVSPVESEPIAVATAPEPSLSGESVTTQTDDPGDAPTSGEPTQSATTPAPPESAGDTVALVSAGATIGASSTSTGSYSPSSTSAGVGAPVAPPPVSADLLEVASATLVDAVTANDSLVALDGVTVSAVASDDAAPHDLASGGPGTIRLTGLDAIDLDVDQLTGVSPHAPEHSALPATRAATTTSPTGAGSGDGATPLDGVAAFAAQSSGTTLQATAVDQAAPDPSEPGAARGPPPGPVPILALEGGTGSPSEALTSAAYDLLAIDSPTGAVAAPPEPWVSSLTDRVPHAISLVVSGPNLVEPEADPAAGELAAVTEAAPAVEPAPTAEPAPEATAAPEVAPAETAVSPVESEPIAVATAPEPSLSGESVTTQTDDPGDAPTSGEPTQSATTPAPPESAGDTVALVSAGATVGASSTSTGSYSPSSTSAGVGAPVAPPPVSADLLEVASATLVDAVTANDSLVALDGVTVSAVASDDAAPHDLASGGPGTIRLTGLDAIDLDVDQLTGVSPHAPEHSALPATRAATTTSPTGAGSGDGATPLDGVAAFAAQSSGTTLQATAVDQAAPDPSEPGAARGPPPGPVPILALEGDTGSPSEALTSAAYDQLAIDAPTAPWRPRRSSGSRASPTASLTPYRLSSAARTSS